MVVIKLCGGMGNQLFQYALGRMLAVIRNLRVRYDPFSGFADDFFGRKYCLHHFNTIVDLIEPGESLKLKYFREKDFCFDPEVASIPDDTYLEGYWQSEKYFKPIESLIREELSLKYPLENRNLEIAEQMAVTNSICLHVRRLFGISAGKVNMNAVNLHGAASQNYYRSCIERIAALVDDPHFFVFGDDPQWARDNLKLPSAATFIDHNGSDRDFEDLRLMSRGKHFIIANSSFSWWGAWLSSSREKKVFAPDRWFNDTKLDTKDLVPDDWTRLHDSNCSEVKVTTHNRSANSGDDQKITVYRREHGTKPVNISVIIPCYNQADYLPEAVKSIVKQSYKNWECIIVNDGSSDNTSDIAQQLIASYPEYSIQFIDKPHSGVSDARNIGIEAAAGQWILPLDSDDMFDPTYMQKAMDIIESEPQVDIVSTNLQKFGSEQGQWEPDEYSPKKIRYKNLLPYATVYRKQLWKKVGGYDGLLSDIKQPEDWSFWINCSRHNPIVKRIPEQLLQYRVHEQSVYHTMQKPFGELSLAFMVTRHSDLYPREHLESAWQMIADSPDEIYQKISEAVDKHSQEGLALFWRGLCNKRRGMTADALLDYQKAAHGVATPTWQALLPLARLQHKQGNAEQARQTLHKLNEIRPDFGSIQKAPDQQYQVEQNSKTKSRILFYCDRLGDSDSSPAGTVIATKKMAQDWFGIDSNAQIHLTGDLVRRQQQHQSFKIIPLPKPEQRQQFLDSYDIVFFATHVRYFKGTSKRPGQLWVLHQHCWYASDPVTMAHWNDFDAFISLSQMHRDSLLSQHVPKEKLIVIPNLIDVDSYKPMDIQRNNHSILFVGGLHPHKGLHILLDALEIVRQQIPDAQLHVYGNGAMWRGGDTYGDSLKKQRTEGVHFHGYLKNEDMPRVYSQHSILCLPSILETFPLVPIEAQACGCIPVVHSIGGAPATLDDGVTGFLYEPNNAEQLAKSIIKAIETIDKDPAIRDRAADFVRSNLNSANTTQFILPLRDKLVKAATINSAKALFQDNNIQAAEDQSKRLLELYPDQPELLLLKGQLALHNGNVEQCRGALQTIIANNATNQMALNNLGVLAIKQGDNVEALRNLLEAYKLNPYDKNTAINCVIVLKANDMLTEARMVLLMYLTKVGED
ncbi:MAG: glycosyltransferase, partial [Planctomycetota bacterium]